MMLLDQGIAHTVVGLLGVAGIEATYVRQLGLSQADDVQILARARADEAIVVTMDGDFHSILAETGATGPSVIRLRIQGMKADGQAALVLRVLRVAARELKQGAIATVDQRSVRLKLLPIVRLAKEI